MSEALNREAVITARAAAEMVVKAATFGKPYAKAIRALAKLERTARRAADDCRDFSNVYPLRIEGARPPAAATMDANRLARLRVAELLGEVAAAERNRRNGFPA